MRKISLLPAIVVFLSLLVLSVPCIAQNGVQAADPASKPGPVIASGPMSDLEPAPRNPKALGGGADFTGTLFRSAVSSSYLEKFDITSNVMSGWSIYYPSDQGADIFGVLSNDLQSFTWSTMGWANTPAWGEVQYTAGFPYTTVSYVNAWGVTSSGPLSMPAGNVNGCFYESLFDGTADTFIDDASGSWSTDYATYAGNGPSSRVYKAVGITPATWMSSTYNYGYSSSLGFNFNADVRRVDPHSNSYGIMCCANTAPSTDYYGFYVSGGSYSLWNYVGGVATSLIGWTAAAEIDTSPGAWNNLKIIGSGTTYRLYINGTQVNSFTDSSHTSGKVGVIGYDPDGASAVQFDNLLCHRDSSKLLDGGFTPEPGGETVPGDDTGTF